MKVKIITGKYKPATGDIWIKTGDITELPDSEARAAIAANVAIEAEPSAHESKPVQNISEPVSEIAARVRGSASKKE